MCHIFFCRGSFLVIITCQSPFSDRTSTLILIKIGIWSRKWTRWSENWKHWSEKMETFENVAVEESTSFRNFLGQYLPWSKKKWQNKKEWDGHLSKPHFRKVTKCYLFLKKWANQHGFSWWRLDMGFSEERKTEGVPKRCGGSRVPL